jgi:hypothetical protein
MVVPSSPADGPFTLEVLTRVPSDSRIAFDIDAVSPLRKASNIRNFFTDASIDTGFSCGGGAVGAVIVRCGVGRLELDLIKPAVPVEGLDACPLEAWWARVAGVAVVIGNEVDDPSFDDSSSSLPSLPRRNLARADDLERL